MLLSSTKLAYTAGATVPVERFISTKAIAPSPNLFIDVWVHHTVAANGAVTSDFSKIENVCRG